MGLDGASWSTHMRTHTPAWLASVLLLLVTLPLVDSQVQPRAQHLVEVVLATCAARWARKQHARCAASARTHPVLSRAAPTLCARRPTPWQHAPHPQAAAFPRAHLAYRVAAVSSAHLWAFVCDRGGTGEKVRRQMYMGRGAAQACMHAPRSPCAADSGEVNQKNAHRSGHDRAGPALRCGAAWRRHTVCAAGHCPLHHAARAQAAQEQPCSRKHGLLHILL